MVFRSFSHPDTLTPNRAAGPRARTAFERDANWSHAWAMPRAAFTPRVAGDNHQGGGLPLPLPLGTQSLFIPRGCINAVYIVTGITEPAVRCVVYIYPFPTTSRTQELALTRLAPTQSRHSLLNAESLLLVR